MTIQSSASHLPPRHAVILCHPDPKSFNRAIADTYCDTVHKIGHEAIVRDLYAMGFDPILKTNERPTVEGFRISTDVKNEIALLTGCEVFLLIYPIWFGTPPAMLKGYVERVFGSGITPRDVGARARKSFLAGKKLISFTTSAMSEPWLNEQGQWLSLRYLFDHYLTHAFGMQADEHVHFGNVTTGMPKLWADRHLYAVEQQAKAVCATVLTNRAGAAARVAAS
jgi:NAD(P)H dehydrogenase (quinone)